MAQRTSDMSIFVQTVAKMHHSQERRKTFCYKSVVCIGFGQATIHQQNTVVLKPVRFPSDPPLFFALSDGKKHSPTPRLAGWLVGWLAGWRLVGGRLVGWLVGWYKELVSTNNMKIR